MPWEGLEFQMFFSIGLTLVAMFFYVTEKISLEKISLIIISVLIAFFTIFPVSDVKGNVLDAKKLIQGFANPALITVLSLLVLGRALVQTGLLDKFANYFSKQKLHPVVAITVIFIVVAVLSAFLNNTPVVVIFIPIIQALAKQAKINPSKLMMPLSFIAIIGGMTTLIGSSTNLLVSSALIELGFRELGFFEFTKMALPLALTGFLYITFILPKIIKAKHVEDEENYEDNLFFTTEFIVTDESKNLDDILEYSTALRVNRGSKIIFPKENDIELKKGDIVTAKTNKKSIVEAISKGDAKFFTRDHNEPEGVVVEAMVTPYSQFRNRVLEKTEIPDRYNCELIGTKHRDRRITSGKKRPVRSGDYLLLYGTKENLRKMQESRNSVLLAGSSFYMPKVRHAKRTLFIFLTAIFLAATNILPILVSALVASTAVVAIGTINVKQAERAIDFKIILIVVSALAIGDALQYTGGAAYIAHHLVSLLGDVSPRFVLTAFFFTIAIMTNIISNNACAVLFTPIGVNIASEIGVEPMFFAINVLLAANCSFASPIGYKTNLLVMDAGKYNFSDFVKYGFPLVVILTCVYFFTVPYFF